MSRNAQLVLQRASADARLARDVGEHAVAVVAIQGVGAVARDVEIDAAVVVHVAGTRAHAVGGAADPSSGWRDVAEGAVALVAEQAMLGRRHRRRRRPSRHPPGRDRPSRRRRSRRTRRRNPSSRPGTSRRWRRWPAAPPRPRPWPRSRNAPAPPPGPLRARTARAARASPRARRTGMRQARTTSRLTGRPSEPRRVAAAPAARRAAPIRARARSLRSWRRCASISAFWMRSKAVSSCSRFVHASHPQQRPAERVVRFPVVGVEPHGEPQQRDGALVVPQVGAQLARDGKRARAGGIDQRRRQILGQRVVEPILRLIHRAEIEVGRRGPRCQRDATFVGCARRRRDRARCAAIVQSPRARSTRPPRAHSATPLRTTAARPPDRRHPRPAVPAASAPGPSPGGGAPCRAGWRAPPSDRRMPPARRLSRCGRARRPD